MRQPSASQKPETSCSDVFVVCWVSHERMDMLPLSSAHGGCGAFGNDAYRTAKDFRQALENEFDEAFSDIAFAITDWSPERRFLGPFRKVFSSNQG